MDAPPLPSDAQAWRECILEVAGSLQYVVLTDSHPDRLIGVGWLQAPVIAGRETLRRLQEGGELAWRSMAEEWARRWSGVREVEHARFLLPQIAVAGRLTIHGSPPVVIESVVGATAGSVWVRLPRERVIFAGDTVVVGSHPPLSAAPDTRAWLETLVELRRARFPAELIVPGRGPLCDKDGTREMSTYIQMVRRRLRSVHLSTGGRGDLMELAVGLVDAFPIAPGERERMLHQVRADLEHVLAQVRPDEEEPSPA